VEAHCDVTVTKDAIKITKIELGREEAELKIGDKLTLDVKVEPKDADLKNISWTSDNSNVASVKDGVITAHQAGKATITASSGDRYVIKLADNDFTSPDRIRVWQRCAEEYRKLGYYCPRILADRSGTFPTVEYKGRKCAAYTEEFESQGLTTVNVTMTLDCKRKLDRIANDNHVPRHTVIDNVILAHYGKMYPGE
jgi:hypothetical protein